MTSAQKEKCQFIIHGASSASAGIAAGLAQLPIADHILLVPIQIGMIVALGKVFGVELTEATAKGVALSMAGMQIGRGLSQVLVGWIPGVGNVINSATAGALTETMGWAVAKRFERGEISKG
jgi:uncharacterized protein (DUF697 family)